MRARASLPLLDDRVQILAAELERSIAGEVRFDRLARAIYASDASIYEIIPAGVVMPRDVQDVITLVRTCAAHGVPIVPRGAGTGIAGGAIGEGVIVDFSRYMTRIGPIEAAAGTVTVEPGAVLDDLNAAATPLGLHFPADVATSSRATLGGMIANNSCGSHSVYYGRTVDYVDELTVVLSDGSVRTWKHAAYDDLPPERAAAHKTGDLEPQSTSPSPASPLGLGNVRPDQAATERKRGVQQAWIPYSPLPFSRGSIRPRGESLTEAREDAILSDLDRIRHEYRDDVLARYPRVMRRNGGYALDRLMMSADLNPATLLIGSEGTLGLVVSAKLRLFPLPRSKALIVLHFASVLDALAATPRALSHRPAAVELVDDIILRAGGPQIPTFLREKFLVGDPRAILVVELYDDDDTLLRRRMRELEADICAAGIGQPARVVFDAAGQAAVWNLRNKGFGLLMSRPGDVHPLEFIEDAAVEPSRLRDYIEELDAIIAEEGVGEVGHYAHASVGVIHVRPTLNLRQPADRVRMRRIAERTCELVLKYGGAMTGEHGDGIVRSEWLERMYGPRLAQAFREVKRAFDPNGLFNLRKIVDPLPMDQRLRAERAPIRLPIQTRLDFSAHGGMAGLAAMCSGVGQCRQKLVGTMCPSYMATLDERHTTRARALALRAALSDQGLLSGLDDPALDEAMDLCLSCKACKTECPTAVDMARLKAEWLSARNRTRGASLSARILAAASTAARLGSLWPALANAIAQSKWTRAMLDRCLGIDRRLAPPRFASRTFRAWFETSWAQRASRSPGVEISSRQDARFPQSCAAVSRGRVIYFVDTWMNHYWPQVGVAAVRLLEAAGFEVLAPRLACCGRPLISKGFLDEAAKLAERNVETLQELIDGDTWLVGSEPSCILTFVDEAPQLVRTQAARRIAARTMTVEQLLARVIREDSKALPWRRSPTSRVLYHGHCHQKALAGTADAMALLGAIPGLAASEINSGCCGMAGSFGHEKDHYEIARAVGEQRLFPAVRNRAEATIAVSGFSCREQISHHIGVDARHLLEVAAAALLPAT
ncbi:MAG: FAD-linked oxidase C-terminal domain-containing protein [Phycisphaerae bacterium]